ncbi:MAG: PD40 domain-containing protein [Ignavibacteriae bacterium]|nr:PD40 domain-containing protein [Ignavibacteriota bacterium]
MNKLFLSCLLLFCTVSVALTQSTEFGKNKVQYKNFDWYFIQSTHFDVYFSDGGEYLSEYTADVAESSYNSISKSFRYQITNRIPIVVYNSHNDFQQTNVVNSYLEEGIGGVTELFKNRVVLPFEGDYAKFRHVIHHELVHAVINDMFYGGSLQNIIANNITLQLPLWFNEGLAEYESLKWDTDSDMFLRDATVHEYLPPIQFLDGYFAYRGGQSLWYYIATKYGEEKIGDILMRVKSSRSVEEGFRSAIGLNIKELSERWEKEQKVLYWPDIAKRNEPVDYARRITDHTEDGSFYNTSPSLSPLGDKIAYISNQDDYFDVFISSTIEGSSPSKLIKGQRTADFEELHLLTPGMAWSPDGKEVALAAKSGEQDAIILVEVESQDEQKIEFHLDGIFSIDWSQDGNYLTFGGSKNGQSDIYVYNFTTKELKNITNDIFSDADPAWSPDGKSIYFVSDRSEHLSLMNNQQNFKMQTYANRKTDVYKINVENSVVTRLTDTPLNDEAGPTPLSDGKHLLLISDLNGINNVYSLDLQTDSLRPLTNSLTGIYQISLSRDGNKMAFSSLHKGGFDLFLMRTPNEKKLASSTIEPTEFIKRLTKVETQSDSVSSTQHQLDISDDVIVKTDVSESTTRREEKSAIDLRHYIFDERYQKPDEEPTDSATKASFQNNVDKEGKYVVNKYRLNFSPDIVYGAAGYNTFYGIQGSTIMAFSDMLGNHQIYLLTNLMFDLKNSDYALAYFYLPKRIDWGIQGFHSARFIALDDGLTDGSLYRFRNYGASLMATYPLDKFRRLDFGLGWLNVTRENLSYDFFPLQQRSVITPSISYIHDNTLWGMIAPANGTRYNISLLGSPKLGENSLGFYSVTADYRRYFKLWKNYTFALRFAGGGSFGENPQRFIVGGVDNWINRKFEDDRLPIENAEDYIFLTSGIPLRGYNYAAKEGTKYAMTNMEFRFPFFGYVAAGPLPVFFQSLNGIFFLDVGTAWHSASNFKGFDKDELGNTYAKDLLIGTGYGLRMIFLGFLVKMDVAWTIDFQSSSHPRYNISLGADY